jgi:hypothetical protein
MGTNFISGIQVYTAIPLHHPGQQFGFLMVTSAGGDLVMQQHARGQEELFGHRATSATCAQLCDGDVT